MLVYPVLCEPEKLPVIPGFIKVHKHLKYVPVSHQLTLQQPLGSLMTACLVYWHWAWHPKSHHNITPMLFKQDFACDRQVFDSRNSISFNLYVLFAVKNCFFCNICHVMPCKHRVSNAYLLHYNSPNYPILAVFI